MYSYEMIVIFERTVVSSDFRLILKYKVIILKDKLKRDYILRSQLLGLVLTQKHEDRLTSLKILVISLLLR